MPMSFQPAAVRSIWPGNLSRPWRILLCSALVLSTGISTPVYATSFTIVDGQVVTTGQSLLTGETGTIEAGGQLNTGGNIAIFGNSGQNNVTVINNGSITTTGGIGTGISITGNNATITNNGSISTGGSGNRGIDAGGANARINNSGTIVTTGSGNSIGINSTGANARINNSGMIVTTGGDADGIRSIGANANITHSGLIRVAGNNAIGISLDDAGADDNTLSNNGTIIATGSATRAIIGGTGVNTVNLQTGSKIIGTIDLGGGTDTVNIQSISNSSTLTILNAETFNLSVPGVVSGNVVTAIDPTGQSLQSTTLNHLTSSFHNVISQRMAQTKALPPIQLAALELAPGMLFQQRAPIVWGEVFGSRRTRGNDGLALAYTHDVKGFTGGYEQDFHKARIGLMGGFADSNASTDTTSIATETDSFFGGVYGHWYLGPVNLTTTLSAGVESHDNDRTVIDNLAGTETANSDFISVFFSPSLTLSSAYKVYDRFEFRPSATLTYNVAWYEDYTESGTTRSNLTIDNRSTQSVNARIQLAVATMLNDTSEFELRSGFTSRNSFDSDTNASLSGASFNYASAGDDSVYGGFVGGNLRFNVTDRLDVLGDVEYVKATGDEDEIAARLRFEYRF